MLRLSKRGHKILVGIGVFIFCIVLSASSVLFAKEKKSETISEGIQIAEVNVSGMNYDQALAEVNNYITTLSSLNFNLHIGENTVTVLASDLGFNCNAEDAVNRAVNLGKSGNVVKRYKERKKLEVNGSVIDLTYQFTDEALKSVLEEKCKAFDVAAVDASLKKTASGFEVTDGSNGIELDVEASLTAIKDFISKGWDAKHLDIDLVTKVTEARSAGADLDKVKDLLGSATTSYSSSGSARSGNVERGANLINGTLLYPGEEFSAYAVVSPISLDNGYFMAASYENGQVVESPGGGICQVSTTLYNAVLKSELEVTQRSNHSMIVTYVDPSKDAAIAGTYKDLKFKNNTQYPIYIEGVTAGKKITFNIYGVETRDPARTVDYVSETVSQTEPVTKLAATGDNFGSIFTSQSSHKGLVAQLWKVVYKNGVEESREVINHSNYSMSPRIVSVGTANASPEALNELNAAIAANDEGAAKAVIAKYASGQNPADQQPQEPQPGGEQPQQPQEGQPAA